MNKLIKCCLAVSVFSLFVSACSDGGAGSAAPADQGGKSNFNPADFTVTQLNTLPENGEAKIQLQLNNLATDDAVYVTVTSDDAENGKLQLSPSKTILNPNKGSASLIVTAKDLGVLTAPTYILKVNTSGNRVMEKVEVMEWGN